MKFQLVIILLWLELLNQQTIRRAPQDVLKEIDPSLILEEGCVICQYLFQKIAKSFDIANSCPDMLDITRVKERQREWLPDPTFFSKWKLLYDAKLDELRKKEMGIIKDGDHVYYVARKEKRGKEKKEDNKGGDDGGDGGNKVYSFPEKSTTRVVAESKSSLKSGSKVDTQSSQQTLNRFNKRVEGEGLYRYNNNSLNVGVKGTMKDYYKRNLDNLINLGTNYAFKENEDLESPSLPSRQSFIQLTLSYQNTHKVHSSHKNKNKNKNKQKYKHNQNRFDNIFNANIMQASGSLTNINKVSVDNAIDPEQVPQKQLTYYDVRHPTTKKVVDRNKGTIETVTDMGAVYKTTVLQPENVANYKDVEHRLDEEFRESDKVLMAKQTALRNRNYSPIAILNKEDKSRGAVFDRMDKKGRLTRHYNYDTTVDIASENAHDIKRVHTNKREGVHVNTEPYKYGKTLIAASKDMAPRQDNHISYQQSSSSSSSSSSTDNTFCCLVPPCVYLPPCGVQNNKSPTQAFLGFIQLSEKVSEKEFMGHSHLNRLLKGKGRTSIRKSKKGHQQMRMSQDENVRRRSRFPDPQWTCAYNNVKEQLDYMCNNEMTSSFGKYCKVLYAQFNVLVESLLYLDPILTLCQNINLCPLGL